MATQNNPNDLTRQQLDELDSLLQRMLSLPLNKPDTVPPMPLLELPVPPPPSPPTIALAPEPKNYLPTELPRPTRPMSSLLSLSPPVPEPEPAREFTPRVNDHPALSNLLPFPIPDDPLPGGPGTLRGVDAPATPSGFRSVYQPNADGSPSNESVPFLAPAPGPSSPAVQTPPPEGSGIGLMTPVYLFNRFLEGILSWCGPLGHWLTRNPVKHLLGHTGLVLLVAAAWWVARGMGWVSWPE